MVSSKSRWGRRATSAAIGLALDALVGDDPLRPHPVALFGTTMTALERGIWNDTKWSGVAYAAAGTGAATVAGRIVGLMPGGTPAAIYTAVAGRGLWRAAEAVGAALESEDLTGARRLLPALVGRDPSELGEGEVARAVIESVAENTVDGIVAPIFWAFLAGAPGALAYRGINTLDSMVGYRDERYRRFGWASARLDDLANFVPSRLSALLVAAARPAAAGEVWAAVRREAPAHPSPNAGVIEAAFGAALGLRFGGQNRYNGRLEDRATMGAPAGRSPATPDIAAAVRLSRQLTGLLFGLLVAVAIGDTLRRIGATRA